MIKQIFICIDPVGLVLLTAGFIELIYVSNYTISLAYLSVGYVGLVVCKQLGDKHWHWSMAKLLSGLLFWCGVWPFLIWSPWISVLLGIGLTLASQIAQRHIVEGVVVEVGSIVDGIENGR